GPHSDCWAMGATIFTLLSGEYVHRADTAGALLAAAATRNARSLGEVMPDLPPPLVRCVDKALAFDAADRWPSAREMRAAFGAAFEEALGEPASAVATRVRAVLLSQSSRGPEKPDPSGAETETPRHRRPNEPPPDAAMRGAEWPLATTPARLEQPWVDSARAARVGAASRRILHCGDGIVTGQFESSCFIIWRDAVTRSTFERQRASLAEVVLNQTEGASFLCIIEPTCQPPDEELRRASVEMVESHGDRLRCVAVVVEGEGFRAAIARAVISAMSLLRRHRTLSVAAFSSVRAALPWMNRFTPISSVGDGVGFIEEARSRLEPHVETSVHPDR
ncbi:MAG TPA: hypothetical protein VNO21_27665, partial [Polyangiaceae bacterium]|nr:hypothetical protein [Polyangiaceae bacterium]